MKTKMKTVLTAFGALMLSVNVFAITEPTLDETKEAIVADWERAKAYTLAYLDAMPEDGTNFRPVEGIRTFAEQMLHIANANIGIMGNATAIESPFTGDIEKDEAYKNKKALREAVVKSYNACINALKNFDMSKTEELVEGFGMKFSRMEWMKKSFEHQTHHRGQTTIYLRMKGVTPPAEKLF